MSEPPSGQPQVDVSGRNAFKIGCMVTLGVFAACFLAFCALPAVCVMGTATVGGMAAASITPTPGLETSGATDVNQTPVPNAFPMPTETPAAAQTPTATPDLTKPLIGSTKDEIIARFPAAQRDFGYETNVDPKAVKLITDPLIIIVYFNAMNVAEGVSFLSEPGHMGNPVDGSGSYVHQNYQMLLNAATGGAQFPVKPNSSTKFPVEIHVGNYHAI